MRKRAKDKEREGIRGREDADDGSLQELEEEPFFKLMKFITVFSNHVRAEWKMLITTAS